MKHHNKGSEIFSSALGKRQSRQKVLGYLEELLSLLSWSMDLHTCKDLTEAMARTDLIDGLNF